MPTADEVAQSYGWELAVINSNADLRRLFRLARKHNWTTEKFQAEFRDTAFFKKHSESWRRMYLLEHGVDKGEYREQHHKMWVQLRDVAQQMGARISSGLMSRMAKVALYHGWSEGEIRNNIGKYVGLYQGRLSGDAASTGMQLRATALANGYNAPDKQIRTWARQVATGASTIDSLQNWIRERQAKAFPSFAKELMAGIDLQDLAAPYVQSMAQLWEQNPAEITMFNPYIRQALSRRSPKTGEPWAMSTTDFEDLLRKNPRALNTQWMQDSVMSAGHTLLQQMGFTAA
jgi:hypothetical protein